MQESEEKDAVYSTAKNDLLLYTRVCDPTYRISKVHAVLAHKLQDIVEGRLKRLIISVPPRVGKTRMACIEMPTWALGKYPEKEIVIVGHSLDLPRKSSRLSRARMCESEYQQIFSTRISRGDARIDEWGTDAGGSYKAVGVGGSIRGRGADIMVCDDLVKDFAAAHSQKQLDSIWDWFWSEARTRLSPSGAIVLIMTRSAVGDPVGRMLDPKRIRQLKEDGMVGEDEDWDVLQLPAIAKENDALGRKPGESIFPERWTAAHYLTIKATTLTYVWSALYDQNPVNEGGNYIPVAKFEIIDREQLPEKIRWVRGWDLATSSKKQNNETAGARCGMGGDCLYIDDITHGRWDWPDARNRIKALAMAERTLLGVEAVGGFVTSHANLVEVLPPSIACVPLTVNKDKLSRALPWIAMVAARKVYLVAGRWNQDFLLQAEKFSGLDDDDDDMIDSVSIAYYLLTSAGPAPMPVRVNDRLSSALAMRRKRILDG